MPPYIERFTERHLPPPSDSQIQLRQLPGGISNLNYKVTHREQSADAQSYVLTLFPNPQDWWKIDKELYLRELTAEDPDVVLPAVFDAGTDKFADKDVAFIIREFVDGFDLDQLLKNRADLGFVDRDWPVIAHDLGARIGALHKYRLSMFGLIGGPEPSTAPASWSDFYITEFDDQIQALSEHPEDKVIGDTRISQVTRIVPDLIEFVGSHLSSLDTIESARLSHGDARFANFIAGPKQDTFEIKAFIDLEWALAGDPEIDLAYIENWLHFSDYADRFREEANDFIAGYRQFRPLSDNYEERRFLYHALRSITYLRAVFELEPDEFVKSNPKNPWYVQQHVAIVHSLASNNYLEDLGIDSLGVNSDS